jgi:DUF971 family protein
MSRPKTISANRLLKVVNIEWDDGHRSEISFELMRAGCPCASCRGGHEKMSAEPDPGVYEVRLPDGPMIELIRIEIVGDYAISFEWADGHHYGIYTWHYLRALCPCNECRGS